MPNSTNRQKTPVGNALRHGALTRRGSIYVHRYRLMLGSLGWRLSFTAPWNSCYPTHCIAPQTCISRAPLSCSPELLPPKSPQHSPSSGAISVQTRSGSMAQSSTSTTATPRSLSASTMARTQTWMSSSTMTGKHSPSARTCSNQRYASVPAQSQTTTPTSWTCSTVAT